MKLQRHLGTLCLVAALSAASVAAIGPEQPEVIDGGSRSSEHAVTVATVNGEPILADDLAPLLGAMHENRSVEARDDFDVMRLVDRAINDRLLAQEARTMGLHEEDPTADQVRRFEAKLVREQLEKELVHDAVEVTDEEVRSAYQQFYRRVSLRIATAETTDGAEAILRRVTEGADWPTVAAELSIDPYRVRGGLIRDLPYRDLQLGVRDVAFDLEPGEVGGPVMTKLGWSVFRVESFQAADPDAFEVHEDEMRTVVRLEKTKARRNEVARQLQERFRIEVVQEAVDAIVPKRLPDGRLIPDVPDPGAVVAKVEDRPILASEYGDALLSRWSGVRNEDAARASAPIVLAGLVEDETIRMEAQRRKYKDRPDIRRKVKNKESELLLQRYLREVVAADVHVTDEQMKAHFEANRTRYRKPPRVRLTQITVEERDTADRIARELRGGVDAAWLARRESLDRFRESGGDRGWTEPLPGVDEVNDALLQAEVGDVLDPFGLDGNWIVVKVTAKGPIEPYTYQEVSGNIREELEQRQFLEVLDRYLATLRSRSEIEIREQALDDLRLTGTMESPDRPGMAGSPHGN